MRRILIGLCIAIGLVIIGFGVTYRIISKKAPSPIVEEIEREKEKKEKKKEEKKLTVISVVPADKTEVEEAEDITVTFSEPVDVGKRKKVKMTVTDPEGAAVEFSSISWGPTGANLIFTPKEKIEKEGEYKVSLNGEILTPFNSTFTVKKPQVEPTQPVQPIQPTRPPTPAVTSDEGLKKATDEALAAVKEALEEVRK